VGTVTGGRGIWGGSAGEEDVLRQVLVELQEELDGERTERWEILGK